MSAYSDAVQAYLANCRANEMSALTIENYERILNLFARSMKQHGRTEPTIPAVSDWKTEMHERGLKVTSMASYMGILDTFFNWAVQMEMLEKNPCVPAIMPSRKAVAKASRNPYTALLDEKEFARIVFGERPKGVPTALWMRNRAVITVFLTTAVRNSELRALTPDDLGFENGTITIEHGKGDKRRVTAFPPLAQQAVKEYLDSGYRSKYLTSSEPLFGVNGSKYAKGWHAFERNSLSELIERNISIMIGRDGIRSHALRHACASIMWDKGMSLEEISALLGHESVKTTEVYAERLRPALPSMHANEAFDSIKQPLRLVR